MRFENKTIQKTATAVWLVAEYLIAFIAYFMLTMAAVQALLGIPFVFNGHAFVRYLGFSFLSGLMVAAVNHAFVNSVTRKLNFFWSLLAGVLLYVFAAMSGLFMYAGFEHIVITLSGRGYSDFEAVVRLFIQIEFYPLLLFLFVVSFPIRIFHLVVNRVGEKNILDAVFDRYRIPHEEERIFMFMDLYGSTAVAEKLGHARYHALLYDVFNDISDLIARYSGEVYQYVGDAVVVT